MGEHFSSMGGIPSKRGQHSEICESKKIVGGMGLRKISVLQKFSIPRTDLFRGRGDKAKPQETIPPPFPTTPFPFQPP
jgi:hypothetical protein